MEAVALPDLLMWSVNMLLIRGFYHMFELSLFEDICMYGNFVFTILHICKISIMCCSLITEAEASKVVKLLLCYFKDPVQYCGIKFSNCSTQTGRCVFG